MAEAEGAEQAVVEEEEKVREDGLKEEKDVGIETERMCEKKENRRRKRANAEKREMVRIYKGSLGGLHLVCRNRTLKIQRNTQTDRQTEWTKALNKIKNSYIMKQTS